MRRRIRNIVFFVLILMGLERSIVFFGESSETFKLQQSIILKEQMDPAAFFYTESDHALRAEKQMRNALAE
ncbi:hypothetical protein [Marinoscillum sp.]|uniref:hypothetical protein n=1 Tax=Marinoscillum sp. TaxID=2024838 RepID=UPI003BAB274B